MFPSFPTFDKLLFHLPFLFLLPILTGFFHKTSTITLHDFNRARFCVFPFQFYLIVSHDTTQDCLLPLLVCTSTVWYLIRFCFPRLNVRFCFPQPLLFIFPFFRLDISTSVLPPSQSPTGDLDYCLDFFSEIDFTTPNLRLGFCGPRISRSISTPLPRSSKANREMPDF